MGKLPMLMYDVLRKIVVDPHQISRHTCSLFPGHALLEEKSCVVAHIKDSPKPPPERVTLTFPVLNRSKNVVFVSTGDGKKEMIKNVLKDKNMEFPAARVLPEKLHWIIDTPASAML